MKLYIHYSRTQFVEIEIIETAKISDLVAAFTLALEAQAPEQIATFQPNP